MLTERHWTVRYGAAVAVVGVALVAKLLLDPVIDEESPFLLFFSAVMVAAFLGGLRPGLLATLLTILLSDHFYLGRPYSFLVDTPGQGLRLAVFALEGAFISYLIAAMNTARRRDRESKLLALRSREGLRESEERYRVVTETASDAIVMIDEDSRILFANSAIEKVFGYTKEEVLDRQLTMLMPERLRGMHQAALERYAATGNRRLDWESVQITGRHKSGEEIPLEISFGEFVKDGEHFFTGFISDITERRRSEMALRQSEERYRAVVEQSTEGLYLLDGDTRCVLESNPALRRMLGYTAEEMRGMEVYDFIAYDREDVDANLERTLAEKSRFVGERRYRRKDGTFVEVEVGVSTVHYGGREVLCATVHDLTERKRTEQTLQEIREAERNRIARDLHDGVLQDLSYTAQALQVTRVKSEGTQLEPELDEQIETILRSARGLREAIYDLRLQSYRDQDFDRLLESLVELTRRRAPDLRVELNVPEGFSDRISRSAGMELLRIVQEALTNVRRHSGASRARVSLGYSDEMLWAEVSDDGWGFDPESPVGAGILGMRERTANLDGRLHIHSEPGNGTTVRFETP